MSAAGARVLVVDDDDAIRVVAGQALRRAGHHVTTAGTLAELDAELSSRAPDVLVTDVALPDGDGLVRAAALAAERPALPVIVFSARNTLTTAVRAAEAGTFDYLPKPFDLDALVASVDAALARRSERFQPAATEDAVPLIGRSPAMQEVFRTIARMTGTDLPVLISGESGTGKRLVARAIHDLGRRAAGPFVTIGLAAIPPATVEAELFGGVEGGTGRFALASGGTLLLDEVGDLPADAQGALLRALLTGEGGPGDVRVIAATSRDLPALVAAGAFREDLFYRLAVVPLALPPLRERRGDAALLARHFLDRAAGDGAARKRLDAGAEAALDTQDWPGNVRELENLMRRLAVLARDERLTAADVASPSPDRGASAPTLVPPEPALADAVRAHLARLAREEPTALDDGTLYDRLIGEVERPLIEEMLARYGRNQLRTARALGINRNTLRKRLSALGIEPGRADAGR